MPKPVNVYPLIILGAGPAGLAAAHQAAQLGFKVALIERTLLTLACSQEHPAGLHQWSRGEALWRTVKKFAARPRERAHQLIAIGL